MSWMMFGLYVRVVSLLAVAAIFPSVGAVVKAQSGQSMLALGDSLCSGAMPPPDIGEERIFVSDFGYTDLFFEYLSTTNSSSSSMPMSMPMSSGSTLQEVCCYGEDTHEYLNGTYMEQPSDGSFCYPLVVNTSTTVGDGDMTVVMPVELVSQSDAAMSYLQTFDETFGLENNMQVIAMSLGANDAISCLFGSNTPMLPNEIQACLNERVVSLVENIQNIVEDLQVYTVPYDIPIMFMLPYNPFLAFELIGDPQQLAFTIQTYSDIANEQLVQLLEPLWPGVLIVDARQVFANAQPPNDIDIDIMSSTSMSDNPAVTSLCWYTGMCFFNETSGEFELEPPGKQDIHPNRQGYELLTQLHIDVWEAYIKNNNETTSTTNTTAATTPSPTMSPTNKATTDSPTVEPTMEPTKEPTSTSTAMTSINGWIGLMTTTTAILALMMMMMMMMMMLTN